MWFSLSEDSIAEITGELAAYGDGIDEAYNRLLENMREIASRTNYKKFLTAARELANQYSVFLCGEHREKLLGLWRDEGESLRSFAEDMYMGEESERAAEAIETQLEEMLCDKGDNGLMEFALSGAVHVSKEDLDEAIEYFREFQTQVRELSESTSDSFENKIEENELYRFLVPIVEAIGVGIDSFSDAGSANMERLSESFERVMKTQKEKVEAAKEEIRSRAADPNRTICFGGETGAMLARALGMPAGSAAPRRVTGGNC